MKPTNKDIIRALKRIQKEQELLEKKVTKIIDNQNTVQDAVDVAAKDKRWLKQFVEDSELDSLNTIASAGSTAAGGISFTHFLLNQNLNDDQKAELIRQTRTDYVGIEHLENNMLITDVYQKADQVELFSTAKPIKKPWYNFWS
jgi:hypothetical protein